MTTIQITLPDALAQEAARAGLLGPETLAALLRERLAANRIARLQSARTQLAADPMPKVSPEEIRAEIDSFRSDKRRAVRS